MVLTEDISIETFFININFINVSVNSSAEAEAVARLVECSHLMCTGAWVPSVAFHKMGMGCKPAVPALGRWRPRFRPSEKFSVL